MNTRSGLIFSRFFPSLASIGLSLVVMMPSMQNINYLHAFLVPLSLSNGHGKESGKMDGWQLK